MSFGFKVTREEIQKVAKNLQEEGTKRGYRSYENFPDGQSRWRIFPAWSAAAAEAGQVCVRVRKHFFRGMIGPIKVAKCLIQQDDASACPLCDVVEKYTPPFDPARKERDNSRAAPWNFRAADTYYFNAIKRATAEGDKVCVLQTGLDFVKYLYTLMRVSDFDILDSDSGCDITADISQKGNSTQKNRIFVATAPTPAFPAGNPPAEIYDLFREHRLSDEDRGRAREAADRLEKLFKAQRQEKKEAEVTPLPPAPTMMTAPAQQLAQVTTLPPPVATASMTVAQALAPETPAIRGWRTKDGAVRPPKVSDDTGKPICYGDWLVPARGNDPAQQRATNEQCKICPSDLACRTRAEKRAAKAAPVDED